MLDRDRSRRILALALPIMAAMASQSLLNLVDAAMVGSLGDAALAAVGIGGYANFMAISLVLGLGAGVQAVVARRKGEDASDVYAVPLNAGLLLGLGISIPILLFFLLFAGDLVNFLNTDQAVRELAEPYLLARIGGVFAVAMNFSYRGYWNGINRSGVYLRTLVTVHVVNVILSYGLIYGAFGLPELGSTGAGIGTTVALYAGSLLYLLQTWREGRVHGFMRALPTRATLASILRISAPNSLQQLLFSAGLTVLFWIIGRIGTAEVAVSHVLITLVLFLILPAIGLGLSATSLVGQALGRRDAEDAYRWGWDVTRIATLLLGLMAMPMWLVPDLILGVFLHDPALIELGRLPLMITGVAICLDGIAIVFTQALLGAGAARSVMLVTLCVQWFFFLPLAYIIGPVLGAGLLGVWILQAGQRLLTSTLLGWLWVRRRWASIEL
ncbi:multidrug/Oligosaccharidyl-lipid/Polysaccharide flippase superfamily protein [Isoalcanivorax pacificus W11-5]|uniref:Multidrug-efflux transporter n=1 Tax=Isoalcanivorax pacificus W11-5 TaxID=391936 RepID=A0A0B4XJ95_9GAMM|nr:MATE family efflux transporter [Isoalcanivorax pacificus]AJD48364.1 multidrug/Oligosaccharidyl-lipid/Polysaccharide flippase superfamily protein [Isoalcanivorax pacificus W11-5]